MEDLPKALMSNMVGGDVFSIAISVGNPYYTNTSSDSGSVSTLTTSFASGSRFALSLQSGQANLGMAGAASAGDNAGGAGYSILGWLLDGSLWDDESSDASCDDSAGCT